MPCFLMKLRRDSDDLGVIPEMQECFLGPSACLCVGQRRAGLQPGAHTQPYVHLNVIRQTSGWTLDGSLRYKLKQRMWVRTGVCVDPSRCWRHQSGLVVRLLWHIGASDPSWPCTVAWMMQFSRLRDLHPLCLTGLCSSLPQASHVSVRQRR